jgi:hypothetical protein
MIDYENVIAGVHRLQRTPQPQGIILGVQHRRDPSHKKPTNGVYANQEGL